MKEKKNLFIILTIVNFLIFPFCVNASCGNKIYTDYKVIVSNANGTYGYESIYNSDTKTYEFTKTDNFYPYETELQVLNDGKIIDGNYYLTVKHYGHTFYVDTKDVKNGLEFKPSNKQLVETDYYVIKDTEVRSGPSILYDVAGTIKVDSNILASEDIDTWANKLDGSITGNWIYISDGTTSGYVYHEKCSDLPISLGKKS